jgi:branched-chain amino acid transport system permease protein
MLRWKYSRQLLAVVLVLFAIAPMLGGNPLAQPGLQQTLAVAFIYGGLALTYDLLFGFTGLLSFGHAIYFGSGMYITCILINHDVVPWYLAMVIAVAITAIFAMLVGMASLRTTGITFAMVTLAFGEAGHVIMALDATKVPQFWIGVVNTKYLYWTALLALIIVYAIIWWITESSAGRVFAALRDNELRVQVLGLDTQKFKLLSFVIAGSLASFLGVIMLLAAGSAAPRFADANLTIALLLMVILGGAVTRWGAVIGGILYSVATTRMQDLTQQPFFTDLPKIIGGPLSEPALTLGILFILVVMFAPGGLSGAYYKLRARAIAKK